MGRRGPAPDYVKREAFARLIAEGVPSARACREVGINVCTGKRWRNGRRLRSGQGVLELPPVITARSGPRCYSPRYLSEDERIRLADLRREGHTLRRIATLMGRGASTISRELRAGADNAGRYHPPGLSRRVVPCSSSRASRRRSRRRISARSARSAAMTGSGQDRGQGREESGLMRGERECGEGCSSQAEPN